MNRLPINPAADKKFMDYCKGYYVELLKKADIHARRRDGDSIESGDFDRAYDDLIGRNGRAQFSLSIGSAATGAGVSGLVQNALDGKLSYYVIIFSVIFFAGLLLSYLALFRK